MPGKLKAFIRQQSIQQVTPGLTTSANKIHFRQLEKMDFYSEIIDFTTSPCFVKG